MARLTRDDWVDAASRTMIVGGLGAVAVEPIAATLGVSKGSFYWHFGRREDLVAAVIERWEAVNEQLISRVEGDADDPLGRLGALFDRVFGDDPEDAAELALLSAADQPLVRQAVDRVTRRRIDFLATQMRLLGQSAAVARRRATFAYTAYLGQLQLQTAAPEALRAGHGGLRRYRDEVIGLLTSS